jgi:hypothetical protein
MSQSSRADWKEFRNLTSGYYKRLKRDFPEDVKKDNIVILRESFAKFVKNFPRPQDRDDALRYLRQFQAQERKTNRRIKRNLDSIPVEKPRKWWHIFTPSYWLRKHT